MYGITCNIDFDWLGDDHFIRLIWDFTISNGENLSITYGLGRFGMQMDAGSSVWPPSSDTRNLSLQAETYSYLGMGNQVYLDRSTYPETGETLQSDLKTYYNSYQHGYQFPWMDTGTADDSEIKLSVYVDGLNCTAECGGLSVTSKIFPDQAPGAFTIFPTTSIPEPGNVGLTALQSNLSITQCNLTILNFVGDYAEAYSSYSPANYFYKKFASIYEVQWSVYSPTDDSSFISALNDNYDYTDNDILPKIVKPQYWYRQSPANTTHLKDDIVTYDYAYLDDFNTNWRQTYSLCPQQSGKHVISLNNGADMMVRKIDDSGIIRHKMIYRKSQNQAWIIDGGALSDTSPARQQPRYFLDSTTKTTWDSYDWFKPNSLYNFLTEGSNYVGRGVDNKAFFKSPWQAASFYRNRWENANLYAPFLQTYNATYTDLYPEMMKKLQLWANDDIKTSGVYRYQFPFEDWYVDHRWDQGAVGIIGTPDYDLASDAAIAFCDLNGESVVISTITGYACPWLYQHPAGNWVVNYFNNGNFYSWMNDSKLKGTFSSLHEQTGLGTYAELHTIESIILKNGSEFIVGIYSGIGDLHGKLIGWYRTGKDSDLEGPYLNYDLDYAHVAYYVMERDDGRVEIGWRDYDNTTWIQKVNSNVKTDLADWEDFSP